MSSAAVHEESPVKWLLLCVCVYKCVCVRSAFVGMVVIVWVGGCGVVIVG